MEMEYCSFGSGARSMVVIPGMSVRSVLLSADMIESSFSSFKKDFTVYVFDRRKDMPEDYSVEAMADDTALRMKELGIADAFILGCSQGGMIAQYIALKYPELVHCMVLGSSASRMNAASAAVMDRWISLSERGDVRLLNHDVYGGIFSKPFLDRYAAALSVMERQGTGEDMSRFAVQARACLGFDVYDRLPEIKCPVLVVGASEDAILSGEASAEMAEKMGCGLYMYENYGHAVYDEAPDFRPRVLEFFRKNQ